MQETQVRSLIQHDLLCCEATRLVYHSYRSCAWEPRSRNYGAHVPQLLKPACTRTHALQQKKPPQWEACTLQLESSPYSLQLEKSPHGNEDSAQSKINKIILKIRWDDKYEILGSSKSPFRFFYKTLWKNPKELFGQHNKMWQNTL